MLGPALVDGIIAYYFKFGPTHWHWNFVIAGPILVQWLTTWAWAEDGLAVWNVKFSSIVPGLRWDMVTERAQTRGQWRIGSWGVSSQVGGGGRWL